MAENKMKPCPFCGHAPEIEVIEPHTHSDWLKEAIPDLLDCNGEAFIFCSKCSAAITGETKEQAIARWNRRADDGK